MSNDNIIDLQKRRTSGGNGSFSLPPPPPSGLPQETYEFYLVDKVTGGEILETQTGHLVVTQHNIVLFNEDQEMTWGIPNDGSLIKFIRVEKDFDEVSIELEEVDIEE